MDWLLGWDQTCGLWKKNIKASAFGWTWESFATEHGESKTLWGGNQSSQIGGLGLPLLIQGSCPAPYAAAILASSIDRATASDTPRAPRCFAWPSLCCSDLNFWGIQNSRALQFWRERKFGTPMAHCLWSDIKLYSVVKVYLPSYLPINKSTWLHSRYMIYLYPLLSTIYCAANTHIFIIISHPAVAFPDKPLLRFFPVASAEKWAVIAAGSSGFWNYRHQAEMMGCIAIVSD